MFRLCFTYQCRRHFHLPHWAHSKVSQSISAKQSKAEIISENWIENWPAHKRDRPAWAERGALSMRSTCCLALLLLAAQWAPINDAAAWSGQARGLCNLLSGSTRGPQLARSRLFNCRGRPDHSMNLNNKTPSLAMINSLFAVWWHIV